MSKNEQIEDIVMVINYDGQNKDRIVIKKFYDDDSYLKLYGEQKKLVGKIRLDKISGYYLEECSDDEHGKVTGDE